MNKRMFITLAIVLILTVIVVGVSDCNKHNSNEELTYEQTI